MRSFGSLRSVNLFDRKLGAEFIESVPQSPGVYEVLDEKGAVVYVGKSSALRRRLQQYRNARRLKRHAKMRAILVAARALRITTCATHLDAVLLENRLIRELRPRFNIAGAFSFLYPCIGIVRTARELALCYTTTPREFAMLFELFGAYRSRQITRDGFDALVEILALVGHREKKLGAFPRVRFSSVTAFRQIGDEWMPPLRAFLLGESNAFLPRAALALLEKPKARRFAAETEACLHALAHFFRFEAEPLRKAREATGTPAFVPQDERDRIFLTACSGSSQAGRGPSGAPISASRTNE